MSANDNGGPAFPMPQPGSYNPSMDGMTLRDYFAAKAMQSLVGCDISSISDVRPNETVGGWLSRKSYAIADAMLKARQT